MKHFDLSTVLWIVLICVLFVAIVIIGQQNNERLKEQNRFLTGLRNPEQKVAELMEMKR